jgi:PAS domain S-box-containing protein
MTLDTISPDGLGGSHLVPAGKSWPLPPNEGQRLASLYSYNILDTPAQQDFDNLITLAAQLADVPVALITLLDKDRQWFLAKKGLSLSETGREMAFCAHTILNTSPLVVPDARLDDRFSKNPLVTGHPYVVFYAGAPLVTSEGFVLGTMCLLDTEPRTLTDEQFFGLEVLARQVMQQLELRRNLKKHSEAENKLRAILDSTSENNLLLGKDYKVLSFNKVLEEKVKGLYGCDLAVGQDFRAYMPQPFLKDFEGNISRALAGQKVTIEKEISIAGGASAWYLFRYFPAVNENGEVIGVTINSSNIDERKRAELLIGTQNKQLLKIAHMQSHQIRGPVATILGLLQLLNRTSLTQENAELVTYLDATAEKLDQTIREIVEATEKNVGTVAKGTQDGTE